MKELMKFVKTVIDLRQKKKVKHKISDIIMLALFEILANANDFTEIEVFGKEHESFVRKYREEIFKSCQKIY